MKDVHTHEIQKYCCQALLKYVSIAIALGDKPTQNPETCVIPSTSSSLVFVLLEKGLGMCKQQVRVNKARFMELCRQQKQIIFAW